MAKDDLDNIIKCLPVGTAIESSRFFRRDLALKVGGFDKDVVFYEEAILPHKIEELGYNVRARINAYILHHEENLTLGNLPRKRYYYARPAHAYLRRYERHKHIREQISLIHRLKIFMMNRRFGANPSLALGVLAMKLLEYVVSAIGYIAGSLASEGRGCAFTVEGGER